jgi:hypothetical protein
LTGFSAIPAVHAGLQTGMSPGTCSDACQTPMLNNTDVYSLFVIQAA